MYSICVQTTMTWMTSLNTLSAVTFREKRKLGGEELKKELSLYTYGIQIVRTHYRFYKLFSNIILNIFKQESTNQQCKKHFLNARTCVCVCCLIESIRSGTRNNHKVQVQCNVARCDERRHTERATQFSVSNVCTTRPLHS